MKSPIQSPPSGRAVILPATLVAAMIAAPMLAFSQTSPGSSVTPPSSAAPSSPSSGAPPSGGSSSPSATTPTPGAPSSGGSAAAPAPRPGTTSTQAPAAAQSQAPGNPPAATGTAPAGQAAVTGSPTNRASRIIGANVQNERNETVGEIEDLIINASGGAPTAVLSVGGFLGIGARLVAVPLSELTFNTERERWVLNGATRETLQQRPAYTYPSRS